MRRVLVLVVSLASGLDGVEARACGDKFLVIGRNPRAQRVRGAVQKAKILMYLDPQSELPVAVKEEGLEADLRLAGHKLRVVGDRQAVEDALRSEPYDLLLAGIGDMKSLEPQANQAATRPTLLPIVYNPTDEELADAERRFRCVMRSPSKKQHYLAVIDDAMVQRQKRARATPALKEQP